jgi:hypothetical protein
MLSGCLRSGRFNQSEVHRRKPHTIEEVMEIVEDMAELLHEDMIQSAILLNVCQRAELKAKTKGGNFQQFM